ncbi:MAG TPA: hypothetical protein VF681_03635 [Abditibacteriaceae bacterium]|jgi:hypothetical protein
MALQNQERITLAFVISAGISAAGILIRFNARSLAATPYGGGVTTYPVEKIDAYVQVGLMLLVFGLVLAAITFNHWLSSEYAPAEQTEQGIESESLKSQGQQNRASIW